MVLQDMQTTNTSVLTSTPNGPMWICDAQIQTFLYAYLHIQYMKYTDADTTNLRGWNPHKKTITSPKI